VKVAHLNARQNKTGWGKTRAARWLFLVRTEIFKLAIMEELS
jgi:hypothetical protein